MAIDPLKKLTLIAPVASGPLVLKTLQRLGCVQVCDVAERLPAGEEQMLSRGAVSADAVEENLRKVDLILHLLDTHAPKRQSLMDALAPLPMLVEREEIDRAVREFDLEGYHRGGAALDETWRGLERRIADLRSQIESLSPHRIVPFALGDLSRPRRTRLLYGTADRQRAADLRSRFAWEILPQEDTASKRVPIVLACLREEEDSARQALAGLGFEEALLPGVSGKPLAVIRELEAELQRAEAAFEAATEQIRALAVHRRTVTILKAYWTSRRGREQAAAKSLQGKWVHVLCGWIRVRDLPKLRESLAGEVPGAEIVLEDPGPEDEVPVSLSMHHTWRPIQGLVSMFGLPPYRDFDPSPFLLVNFYVFFGICFSDVGYGVMLVLFSLWLAHRNREHTAANDFARNLLYAGLSTIVFGVLLGSWFGDLPKYLGEGNFLLALQQRFAMLDPLTRILDALLLALGIGILNQFYGIAVKMYGALRQGDWTTAICDGLFWLIALPGLVIMAARMFVDLPPALWNTGLALFLTGSLGLVLTQGRDVKHPVGRLLTGVVSLYGIVGSYGFTAFLGDVLSYCRLLALGLTTGIVANTFNMLADMAGSAPVVGPLFFIVILLAGHVFNFLISLLGAFIHSMRLIYVEFFGRFYEGGSQPFRPLGFDSPLAAVREPAKT
ncbi:MAG: hypothetical protein HY319_09080 [Armatimonadetes bacterium]|nr:hypothetical protein [Armatimonadota bacterium]